jgi:ribonucleoside-diphosphate reductase alpha chain
VEPYLRNRKPNAKKRCDRMVNYNSKTVDLPTVFQSYIHVSRYSRHDWKLGRRETWTETVDRWCRFFQKHVLDNHSETAQKALAKEMPLIRDAILNLRVMPSMRTMMTAGPALERDHIAAFNCSYLTINRVQAFDELLYILMCGTGVGFSVERQYVTQLPTVAEEFHPSDIVIQVQDSKLGWAKSLKELISLLYQGQVPKWDVSKVRPSGTPLMTFGGRASGPEPLVELFKFTVDLFKRAAGRKLSSIEAHDLVCKIADIVVVGGVRRAALISLSNPSDDRLRTAKSGQWWEIYPHRRLANNSAAYTEKPEVGVFMDEWKALYESKSGERGIFNREAAKAKCSAVGRNPDHDFGVNPCGEIILRDREFCNLSEAIVREDDDVESLTEKVRIAAVIGTLQSTLTDFKYVSKKWEQNCVEERLLGVSLTGIMDSRLTNGADPNLAVTLDSLRAAARAENVKWAKLLDVVPSAAVTCIKPSGTVSSLVDSSPGIHPRFAKRYVRRVRMDNKDPLLRVVLDAGFRTEPDVMAPHHTTVISFPVEAPAAAITKDEVDAVGQLELWRTYRNHWCDHNPSITVNVRENEWVKVGAWVYDNFDEMTGVSFLPFSDHTYKQAPYEVLAQDEFESLRGDTPTHVEWVTNSETDTTVGSQELACSSADGCAI